MADSETIAALNDELRRATGPSRLGRVVLTRGVAALDEQIVTQILKSVRDFDNFDEGDNPYGERDFGAFESAAGKVFWKIDYFDNDLKFGSEDPANVEVAARVLTIMLAEEY